MTKVALVTGGSRGIGAAISKALQAAGFQVAANYAGNDDAARAFTEETGIKTYKWSVADYDACAAGCRQVEEELGPIAVLVNNAGITRDAMFHKMTPQQWKEVIDTNLTAAFVIGREAARRMAARGRGKIVNIGSLTSDLARPTIAPYAVSKGGIKMLTRAMAAEWGALGIQANAIGPGYMVTDMNQALIENPDFDAWVKARTPMRRWGQPEELVGLAIFLSSDASNFVSGQLIYADGGITAVL